MNKEEWEYIEYILYNTCLNIPDNKKKTLTAFLINEQKYLTLLKDNNDTKHNLLIYLIDAIDA